MTAPITSVSRALELLEPPFEQDDGDWEEIVKRANLPEMPVAQIEPRAGRPAGRRHRRRRLVLALALVLGVVFVAVAIAQSLGGFSNWLSGDPGEPASQAEQQAFDRSIRSWSGFPSGTQLRKLVQTSVGGATYTVYGFRAADSLCLRLVVTGNQSAHELACPPLSQLRSSSQRALVVVADYGVGEGEDRAPAAPFPVFSGKPPKALVTLGIVADGIEQVEVAHDDGKTIKAVLSSDTFLSVEYQPSASERLTHVWATAGGKRVGLPFTLPVRPFEWPAATAPRLSAHGPAAVQRVVHGGTIGWLARRQPVGVAVAKTIHNIVGVLPSVTFARVIAPDPAAPERMVVSVRPAGKTYFGRRLRNNRTVCGEVIGGRYGNGGGCWPAGRMFSTAPFTRTSSGSRGSQYVTIAGLASDDVARLTLHLGSGQQEAVPLHDNGYIIQAPATEYPFRLVAYDSQGLVIGVATLKGDPRPAGAAPPQPVAGATWRRVVSAGGIEGFVVPSTSGGRCYAFRDSGGGGSLGCPPAEPPNEISLGFRPGQSGTVMTAHTGSAIARLVIHYSNGHTQAVDIVEGVAIAAMPPTDAPRAGLRGVRGVGSVSGLDSSGRVVATRDVASRISTGGSGTIDKLTASAISIGATDCKIASTSPPLAGYGVGIRVQYLCRGGTLTLIGRSSPGHTWASRTVLTRGPIAALSTTSITVEGTSCPVTAASPSVTGYHKGERVQIFCAADHLTGINHE